MEGLKQRERNIDSIQAVRAIAAIFVLLYHASALISHRLNYDLTSYFWYGYSGVDIFFVLSGFIIFYSASTHKNLTSTEFFARRLIRIYPIFWLATLSVVLIAIIGKYFHFGDSDIMSSVSALSFESLIATLLLIPKSSEIILVAWTLSYEMMFYVIFALLFFKNKKSFLVVMALWVIASSIFAFILHSDYSGTKSPFIAMLNPIMVEFLFGCGLAVIFQHVKHVNGFLILAVLCVGIGIILTVALHKSALIEVPTKNQYLRFWDYGVPAAIFIFSLLYLPLSYPKSLLFLGDASYSIYLFHYPLMGIIARVIAMSHLPMNNIIGFMLTVGITTLICCMIYQFIEKPILDFGKHQIKSIKNLKLVLQTSSPR